MAEKEGDHRREVEQKMTNANIEAMRRTFREARWGQMLAFLISGAFLLVGAYVAVQGQPWVGGVLGTMGLSTIVASFITGRHRTGEDHQKRDGRTAERPTKKKRGR